LATVIERFTQAVLRSKVADEHLPFVHCRVVDGNRLDKTIEPGECAILVVQTQYRYSEEEGDKNNSYAFQGKKTKKQLLILEKAEALDDYADRCIDKAVTMLRELGLDLPRSKGEVDV